MGRAVDRLEETLETLQDGIENMRDESVMMHLFDGFMDELPEFEEHRDHVCEEDMIGEKNEEGNNKVKLQHVVRDSNKKAMPFASVKKELFHPEDETNKTTDDLVKESGSVAVNVFLEELHNPKKVTWKCLTSLNGECSWGNTTDEGKAAGLHKSAVDDAAEEDFGETAREFQVFGGMKTQHAAGVSQSRQNHIFSHGGVGKTRQQKKEKTGIFHVLPDEMRLALLTMAMEDQKITSVLHRKTVKVEQKAKAAKELTALKTKEKGLTKCHIDVMCCFEMGSLDACFNATEEMDHVLSRLLSDAARVRAVKESFNTRVIGRG